MAAIRCRPRKQVDGKAWQHRAAGRSAAGKLARRSISSAGDRLGFDPWLHTSAAAERLAAACAKAGAELVAVDSNPLDAVWTERPAAAARPGRGSRPAICRRSRSRQARRASALEIAQARRRRAGAVGFATRWPGPSTSAAPTSRIRRCRCPMRWCRRTAGPTVFIDHRKLSNSARDHLEQTADVARAGRADADADRAGASAAPRSRSTAPPPPTR